MPDFKKAFKDLSGQFDKMMDRIEGNRPQQQQTYNQYPGGGYGPPPVPSGSHPGQQSQYGQQYGQQYGGYGYGYGNPPPLQQQGSYHPQYPGQPQSHWAPQQHQYGQPPVPPHPSASGYQSPPPPVPSSSRPGGYGAPPAGAAGYGEGPPPYAAGAAQQTGDPVSGLYYNPTFAPHISVSEYFDYDLGAGGWGNEEVQTYTSYPANSFHTPDGKLVIRANVDSKQKADREKYTSARLLSKQRLSKRRGYLSAVIQAPCAKGIWPAFWLLPEEPFSWPTDGEVDIFEAWNAGNDNHSCLHWGGYSDPADKTKHRTVVTKMDDVRNVHEYGFAWDTPEDLNDDKGRMIWYIDGQAVMRCEKPAGTRRIEGWRILLNVAMAGTVCDHVKPDNGTYDFVIHRLIMSDVPPGGWGGDNYEGGFARDYKMAAPGRTL